MSFSIKLFLAIGIPILITLFFYIVDKIFGYQIFRFTNWICPCIRRLQAPQPAVQARNPPQPQGNGRREGLDRIHNRLADSLSQGETPEFGTEVNTLETVLSTVEAVEVEMPATASGGATRGSGGAESSYSPSTSNIMPDHVHVIVEAGEIERMDNTLADSLSQGETAESRTGVNRLATVLPSVDQAVEDDMAARASGGATRGSGGAESSYSPNTSNMMPDDVHSDVEAGGSPSPVVAPVTAYFPDDAPTSSINQLIEFFSGIALGVVHWWRGSIVIQATVSIDSSTLVKLEEFAKKCSSEVEGFYLQIAEWGIFFRSGGSFQLYRLKEGEAPEIFDIAWRSNSGFVLRGFYLNGSNINKATKQSRSTLRTAGPPLQICGLLEELFVPTEGQDVGKSLIFASRVIDVNGSLLTVRSQATHTVPPVSKSFKERSRDKLLKILQIDTMKKALLRLQVLQPKIAQRWEILEKQADVDTKSISALKTKLLVEHWKGVSESEMLDFRKKVLHYLQQLPSSELDNCTDPRPSHFVTRISPRDREYWRGGLHDLNEVIRWYTDSSQSSILFRVRGRTKLFLGDFESALQDFDLADHIDGRPSSTAVLERAIVKCALARYPEAMQDVIAAAAMNRNLIDGKKLQICLIQILVTQDIPFCANIVHETVLQQPQLSNKLKHVQGVPDLLTGDEWSSDLQRTSSYHSKYFSARIQRMKEAMIDITNSWNAWEFKIEASKAHWTELVDHGESSEVDCAAEKHQDVQNNFEKLLLRTQLEGILGSYQRLFTMPKKRSIYSKLGRKIAEGGQAEIFEVVGWPEHDLVVKVYKLQVTTVAQLQKQLRQLEAASRPGASPAICKALGANLLEDNRFALVFPRYWGDLRTLIDQRMMNKPLDQLTSPFHIKTSLDIMYQIAEAMEVLHTNDIVHRDLKAANVLINTDRFDQNEFRCTVADFECSIGVVGTGFWRAPEVLMAVRDRILKPEVLTKKCDVYSYAMTCYEILTGSLPFEDPDGESTICAYDTVLSGCRPSLPSALNSRLTGLIEHCWHTDPERRPSFSIICEKLRRLKTNIVRELSDQVILEGSLCPIDRPR